MPIIPAAPADVRKCRLYEILLKKSSHEDGAAERAEIFLQSAIPVVDLTIAGPFREYTLHNRDHSKKVIHLMGQIISPATLDHLSVLECLLLAYSSFLHDMGLSITSVERDRFLTSDEFLDSLQQWPEISDALTRARERLSFSTEKSKLQLETEIYQLQEAALSAYLRPLHATRERYQQLIKRLKAGSGRSDLFEVRGISFEEPLIDICVSHNLDAASLAEVEGLYKERYPRDLVLGGERSNIQFCAAALRLADILDFDRERTPRILFESLGISSRILPGAEVSLQEWQKHMSVHSLAIEMDEIVVSADSHHPALEKAVRDFCLAIEREVRDTQAVLRQNTAGVTAKYAIELPISVRARVRSVGYMYKDMSLELNQAAISSLLMGERLYSHPAAALRELIQNAIDATLARTELDGTTGLTPRVDVAMETDEVGRHWIKVTDDGVGMDEHVLTEYFLKLGNSYYESPEFRRLLMQSGRSKDDFNPISRFGIGLMSVFMIADVLRVDTMSFRSPRGDGAARSVRVERLGALAFVTDSADRAKPGTTIRARLSPRYESSLNGFVLAACAYLREKIRHPRFDVHVSLPPLRFTLGRRLRLTLRADYKSRLPDKSLEIVVLDIGRWSNRLAGTVAVLLSRTSDGKLSHTLNGEQLRFGGQGIDPQSVINGYESNIISVNGFRMSLKKMNRILGTSKNRVAVLFDIDVLGDDPVTYDVSRDRIIGSGGTFVRESMRDAITKGLDETGIFEQLTDSTKALIQVASPDPEASGSWIHRQSTSRLAESRGISDDLLKQVTALLPRDSWPQGIHKTVAAQLGISNGLASVVISLLLETGAVTKPLDRAADLVASPTATKQPLRTVSSGTMGPAQTCNEPTS
jgi:molecular chaperone HtpG